MSKEKSIRAYIQELKKMIKQRTGVESEMWLLPQIRATAMNMVMLDKVQEELTNMHTLVTMEYGSKQQTKKVQNPLLVTYKDLQRVLVSQLEALGLNYKVNPSKVKGDTRKGVSEGDKMADTLESVKSDLDDVSDLMSEY